MYEVLRLVTPAYPALCGSILRARAARGPALSIEEEIELSLAENGPQTIHQLVLSTGARGLLRAREACVRTLVTRSLLVRGRVEIVGKGTVRSVDVSSHLRPYLPKES